MLRKTHDVSLITNLKQANSQASITIDKYIKITQNQSNLDNYLANDCPVFSSFFRS